MPTIYPPASLERHVHCPPLRVSGESVHQALQSYFGVVHRARRYILDDQSRLRPRLRIYVNGRLIRDRIRMSDALGIGDEVRVLCSPSQATDGGGS